MSTKPIVILDPHFRRMDEIFSSADRARLHEIADVVWGKDEPMPDDEFLKALHEAEVIICAMWRYGGRSKKVYRKSGNSSSMI